MNNTNNNWGGWRDGAGRPKGEDTQFIGVRLPVSLVQRLDTMEGTRTANVIKAVKNYLNGRI